METIKNIDINDYKQLLVWLRKQDKQLEEVQKELILCKQDLNKLRDAFKVKEK